MRTTLNIDEKLLADFKQLAACGHRSLSAVIEDALRESLARRSDATARSPVELPTFGGGWTLPGVDLDDNVATRRILEAERDERFRKPSGGDE